MYQSKQKDEQFPPRLFGAPFVPAVVNFTVQMGIMLMSLTVFHTNPLWFIPSFLIGHIFVFLWCKPSDFSKK